MTKPIMKNAINYCMSFKEIKVFLMKLLVAPACLHDWPHTFFIPKVF